MDGQAVRFTSKNHVRMNKVENKLKSREKQRPIACAPSVFVSPRLLGSTQAHLQTSTNAPAKISTHNRSDGSCGDVLDG